MNPVQQFLQQTDQIEERLGYKFKDQQLLLLAFTHRSFINEYRDLTTSHNERLEFLGDSVLGLLVAKFLYENYGDTPEGDLSYLRSRVVQAGACATYLAALDVESYLLLGKGERRSEGRGRESIAADLFEGIMGAIFLDGGLEATSAFLFDRLGETLKSLLVAPERNWKAELQDHSQRRFQEPPVYEVLTESGPDHSKNFVINVAVNGEVVGTGEGSSKKEAQQGAAQKALEKIDGDES